MTRIFTVRTAMPDTKPGQTWDRFNVSASTVEAALTKAKARLAVNGCKHESVLDITLIAEAD